MTHLWKTRETYIFDMPKQRVMDVYGKNARHPLKPYMMCLNPKITDVRFDEYFPGVLIDVDIPKYPNEHPYFSNEDVKQLLTTYMEYANMSMEEILNWYAGNSRRTEP